jgi:hypothetical protein
MRKLDSKFSVDGDQIIKTSNGEAIPEDEPVMIFRGRDRLALPLIRIYEQLGIIDGCNDYHAELVGKQIAAFEKFAEEHPERMKQPSVTRGL